MRLFTYYLYLKSLLGHLIHPWFLTNRKFIFQDIPRNCSLFVGVVDDEKRFCCMLGEKFYFCPFECCIIIF
jgi:hypothetical protein